ncbi:phage head-tail joining protein [Xinfangfangia pollutisoli]|uniref:phage head-tail joining protein n=1 Tax=Xinfangfangia pollutisoli TaxID=2865960 RepID=UPI001CD2FADD|nr:hypothetical protein [Xinfangfangia pollutisoli]
MSAYTLEDYQRLCAMIAKGVTALEVNGEKVTFRSLAEMTAIRTEMEGALGLARRARVSHPAYRKG